MTPLDVAKYLRAFQKAATTRKVKSRMIRRDSRFDDNLAELIRAVLPKAYFRLLRRRRGYELQWCGEREQATRVLPLIPTTMQQFRSVATEGAYRWQPSLWIGQPTEELLDQSVALQPILARFKRDEARRANGEVVEPVAAAMAVEVEQAQGEELLEENEEEVNVGTPVVVAEEIRPTANPQNLAEQFAAAARAREDALAGREQAPAFATEGERAFAAMLARATRRV